MLLNVFCPFKNQDSCSFVLLCIILEQICLTVTSQKMPLTVRLMTGFVQPSCSFRNQLYLASDALVASSNGSLLLWNNAHGCQRPPGQSWRKVWLCWAALCSFELDADGALLALHTEMLLATAFLPQMVDRMQMLHLLLLLKQLPAIAFLRHLEWSVLILPADLCQVDLEVSPCWTLKHG